ncbi:hypothetical protein [Cellvibrio sp. QJXJ]|uniref:hypothetical protein n=1 Tax=Cellvibrio sp. QJXJ TaxID=2964606 RepID=UPI0021C30962|nr:hypothetical protein [Cellvibrio sp. QJXJ]UUA73384.1 hypothetical protein NNX04_02775 [Cellvibrio sp. QJXJ]
MVEKIFIESGIPSRRRGDCTLYRVENPSKLILRRDLETLRSAFCKLTDKIYGADTAFHWYKHDQYFDELSKLWVIFIKGNLIGMATTKEEELCGEHIIYIDCMNIFPVSGNLFWGQSLGALLGREILLSSWTFIHKPVSVIFRTQNANVYSLGYSVLPSGIYPQIGQRNNRDLQRSQRIAKYMAEYLSPGKYYELDKSVIRGAYYGYLYGNEIIAKSSRADLNQFFKENINKEEGDALLIVVSSKKWEFIAAIVSHSLCIFLQKINPMGLPKSNVIGRMLHSLFNLKTKIFRWKKSI